MFMVTETDAAAIRAAYEQEGVLSATIELRKRFPGIADNAHARVCATTIAGWTKLPDQTPAGAADTRSGLAGAGRKKAGGKRSAPTRRGTQS